MRLACYCRFSSDMQRDESIDAQLRIIHQWAESKGHTVTKEYCDRALSGKNDDRPEFQKMISDRNIDLWDAVVVHKIDRFSRDKYDNVIYKKKLKDAGKKFFSVSENIDDSPISIVTESLLEGLSEYYIANLRTEVRKGLNENAYKCQYNGGTPPLGYDVDINKKYVINEHEANIVREIFRLYLAGNGLLKIALELNSRGFKTKLGNPFGKNSLYDIIGNERYSGVYIYNQSINSNKRVQNDKIIKIDGGMPQIISKEDFEKVMERRKLNKRTTGSNRAKYDYALSGLITCGLCGQKYFGNTTTRKRKTMTYKTSWYMCSAKNKIKNCDNKNIKCDEIESKVYNLIKTKILDINTIETILDIVQKEYNIMYNNVVSNSEIIEKRIFELNTEINNYIKAIGNGLYSEEIKNKLEYAESNRKQLKEELDNNKQLEKHKIIKKEELLKVLKKDFTSLKADKKQLFQKWIKDIKITRDTAEVHFNVFDSVASLTGGECSLHDILTTMFTIKI